MNAADESRWLAQLRTQLDEDARDLDAETASKLNRARQRALDAGLARRRSRYGFLAYALTASIAALLALSVLVRVAERPEPMPAVATAPTADDLDLLAGTEELEMIEDLEFYAWLELQSLDG
jgi:hypothetical protein